ncbi:MAG: hypothetical protein ACLTDC_10875 [Lachnospiraceae bacterium]
MMATGAEVRCRWKSVILAQASLFPATSCRAGMVGYMTGSIKNVKDTRVGDTDHRSRTIPCAEPLPGYKRYNPMVYCGLYPADGAKYPDLRDALEKLQLNDASLVVMSRRHPLPLALVSAADSWDCCIWKSFRNVWRESTTLIW